MKSEFKQNKFKSPLFRKLFFEKSLFKRSFREHKALRRGSRNGPKVSPYLAAFAFMASLCAMLGVGAQAMASSRDTPTPGLVLSSKAKISLDLQLRLNSNEKNHEVLVIMAEQADLRMVNLLTRKADKGRYVTNTLRSAALTSQKAMVEWLASQKVPFRRFYIRNMIAIPNASAALIRQIAARHDVARIIADVEIETNRVRPRPSPTLEYEQNNDGIGPNIVSTGADRVWSEFNVHGENIVVASQDTGAQWTHPALKSSYRGFANGVIDHSLSWHDAIHAPIMDGINPCGVSAIAPCDDDQHGTHTVGTMVGDDGSSNKIGMAPKAQWMACRNMDRGTGRPSTYLECFEFFLAPYAQGTDSFSGDPSKAPHIINNSWGCPASENCHGDEMMPALEALAQAGIMVVVSAGNEGPACGTIADTPAHHTDLTLSVGAHDHRNGGIASFSSRGPSGFDGGIGPDVTAPGVNVRSAVPGDGYEGTMWSGTSMAGPHVAGLVALMWSAQPKLIGQIQETIQIIRQTATPKTTTQMCGNIPGDQIPNNTYGYGSIDAFKAVEAALRFGDTSTLH